MQLLLIFRVITFQQQNFWLNLAFGLIGVWMILTCRTARRAGSFPRGLAWFGIVIGAMWVLSNVFTWIGGPMPSDLNSTADLSNINPVLMLGYALFSFAYFALPLWAIWLGRVLRARSGVNTVASATP